MLIQKPNAIHPKCGDWCHLCGKRDGGKFIQFTVSDNAELSTNDAKRGYFRICQRCIGVFVRELNSISGPISKDVSDAEKPERPIWHDK